MNAEVYIGHTDDGTKTQAECLSCKKYHGTATPFPRIKCASKEVAVEREDDEHEEYGDVELLPPSHYGEKCKHFA